MVMTYIRSVYAEQSGDILMGGESTEDIDVYALKENLWY